MKHNITRIKDKRDRCKKETNNIRGEIMTYNSIFENGLLKKVLKLIDDEGWAELKKENLPEIKEGKEIVYVFGNAKCEVIHIGKGTIKRLHDATFPSQIQIKGAKFFKYVEVPGTCEKYETILLEEYFNKHGKYPKHDRIGGIGRKKYLDILGKHKKNEAMDKFISSKSISSETSILKTILIASTVGIGISFLIKCLRR